MAKRKKRKAEGGGAAWLVTFADMMTLMLTFFVLLVSMAVIDERRKLVVIGSIMGAFGPMERSWDYRSVRDQKRTVEPGPMDLEDTDDLEPMKEAPWEDVQEDLNFQSNRFVDIISINDRLLFAPGEHALQPKGVEVLDRLLPFLLNVDYPLLLAGHTASMREEEGEDYKVVTDREGLDPSWELSFLRVMAVYRHYVELGMDPEKLRVEAFGRFRTRYPENTAEGRARNRRVDIVLDRRNERWIESVARTVERRREGDSRFRFRDFFFKLDGEPGGASDQDRGEGR